MGYSKLALAAAVTCAGMALTAPATAAVLVSQQPTANYAGPAINRSDGQNFLNQFSLATAATLNGLDILSQAGVTIGQAVTIKIRTDVGGSPAATNLFTFNSTISSISGGFLHADFANTLLAAGTYYIGMTGTNSNIGQDIYRDTAFPIKAVQLSGDNVSFRTDFATGFRVYGNAVAPAVPEPATWAMMIFGMGGVGFAMRRRGKVATKVSIAA